MVGDLCVALLVASEIGCSCSTDVTNGDTDVTRFIRPDSSVANNMKGLKSKKASGDGWWCTSASAAGLMAGDVRDGVERG